MKPVINQTEGADSSPLEKAINQEDLPELPDFRFIYVTLTFDGFLPFKFKLKRQQSKEVKAQKQAFYGLTDAEQAEKLVSYRVNILAGLLAERPLNVQGWPTLEGGYTAELVEYFNDPENEELLQWVWTQYQDKLYPKELLSSLLG